MSRIGKAPINVPDKVEVTIDGQTVTVKGPKGSLTHTFRPEVKITRDGNVLTVERIDEERQSRSLHGLSRTLLNNMVVGVSQGFERQLEMVGVGYRAAQKGSSIEIQVGYSHPVVVNPPPGVELAVEQNTKIFIRGADKEAVGQVAANIRAFRKPEPYKGKGIKYAGERIRRKAGKSGKK